MPKSDLNWREKGGVLYPPTNNRFKRKSRESQISGVEKDIINKRGEGARGTLAYAKAVLDKEAGKRLQKYIAKTNRGQK